MDEDRYFEKIAEYKLLAKHEVGQNFLIDKSIAKRIVSLGDLRPNDKTLEIGSGAGSLSYYIAESPCESDLIDIDEALVLKLQSDFSGLTNIRPQMGNVMRFDLAPYTKIIGNLPYYITSGILERILLEATNASLAVLMVQKEVAIRLNAPKGSEDYGPLPILLRYRADFVKGFLVPRTAFSPAPHVDSSVFVLRFKHDASIDEARKLYILVSKLFLHRRKTILNNLETLVNDPAKARGILEKSSIDPIRRPEDLSLEEYQSLLSQLY